MSHSVPSESSAIDTAFLVGADLVEFDHRNLPIYQTAEARWDCFDEQPYGAPLDRLFGEPGDVHIDGAMREPPPDIAALGHDPLVALTSLSDGMILPEPLAALDTSVHVPPEAATTFDFGAAAHAVVHLHDGWTWDIAGADWMFGA
jgi:hypothetical protein